MGQKAAFCLRDRPRGGKGWRGGGGGAHPFPEVTQPFSEVKSTGKRWVWVFFLLFRLSGLLTAGWDGARCRLRPPPASIPGRERDGATAPPVRPRRRPRGICGWAGRGGGWAGRARRMRSAALRHPEPVRTGRGAASPRGRLQRVSLRRPGPPPNPWLFACKWAWRR